MNAEITQAVAEMAVAFGTTPETLFQSLLKQAPIAGAIWWGCWGIALCIFILVGVALVRAVGGYGEYIPTELYVRSAIFFVLALIAVTMFIRGLPVAIAMSRNPEYWVIQHIAEMATSKNPKYWVVRRLMNKNKQQAENKENRKNE